MVRTLISISLALCLAGHTLAGPMFFGCNTTASAPSYLIHEDFETTGTPSGWNDSGTVNWDYSASPIAGSQSFSCSLNGQSYKSVGVLTDLYARFRFKTGSIAAGSYFFAVWDNAVSAAIAWVKFNAGTGEVTIVIGPTPGVGDVATTVTQMATGTVYYVWVEVHDNGANVSASVAFNTALSQPTSGNAYAAFANSTKTSASPGMVNVTMQNVAITTPVWDDLIVSSTAIGNAAF